ncbi:MAG TPA: T9SS type A sorting domain-containing protein [Bacteroidales bacterium]|nr:T9SS type A sorting domain-containing protein [Bacteroidales bacterium]
MIRKGFVLFAFAFLVPTLLLAQEFLTPSTVYYGKSGGTKKSLKSAVSAVGLPFFDDFSYRSSYPDPELWFDRKVYVNTHYGIKPVSLGVATFDMLDENGQFYPQLTNAFYSGADTLTSQPIDLSGYSLSDSLYLSFYYQAGGYGDFPEEKDSLKVEFFSSRSGKWQTVWSVPGLKGDTVAPSFKIALIPIKQLVWIDSIFQFRFVNIVSVPTAGSSTKGSRANGDIWNIDYVLLNKNRSYTDTAFNDIAIVEPLGSFLKNYRSIPWRHYQNKFYQAIRDKINLSIFNLNNFSTSVEDKIVVTDVFEGVSDEPISTAIDIPGRSYSTFEEDCPILKSDRNDSALFRITAAITTNRYDRKGNDTAVSYQFFKNYYAYDDGTAEFGYGLKGSNIAGGWVAYRFGVYQQDTLIAVDMFFNRSINDENEVYFNLCVWDDRGGFPNDSIGGKLTCKVQPGGFVRYYLQNPILTPPTFYVGWQQIDETYLNVGYDRNSPNNQNILYNIDGSWTPSSIRQKGALMIRPVFGKRSDVGVVLPKNLLLLTCYPNPAREWTRFVFSAEHAHAEGWLSVYDLTGKLYISQQVYSGKYISLSQIPEGVYVAKIRLTTGQVLYCKLIRTP